jgi:hypothetical protein
MLDNPDILFRFDVVEVVITDDAKPRMELIKTRSHFPSGIFTDHRLSGAIGRVFPQKGEGRVKVGWRSVSAGICLQSNFRRLDNPAKFYEHEDQSSRGLDSGRGLFPRRLGLVRDLWREVAQSARTDDDRHRADAQCLRLPACVCRVHHRQLRLGMVD